MTSVRMLNDKSRDDVSEPKIKITPDLILNAYSQGYFPMAEPETGEINWYSPDPRGIFPIETYKPKKSFRNILNRNLFEIRYNTSFSEVMRGCADRSSTWISEEIIGWYVQLHLRGFAHSVEVFQNDELVGGLYGVSLRGAFFGESMFSRVTNASKVALHHLIGHLKKCGFILLDTQFMTEHLLFMGAKNIPRSEYLKLLESALKIDTHF